MPFQVAFDIDNPYIAKDIFSTFDAIKKNFKIVRIYKSSNAVPYYFWPNCVPEASNLQTFRVQDNPIESLSLYFRLLFQISLFPTTYLSIQILFAKLMNEENCVLKSIEKTRTNILV